MSDLVPPPAPMPDPSDAPACSPGAATSVALAAEQAYLRRARAALARMRERTLSLQADGGDALAAESLSRLLRLRATALQDDPRTSLFFGRIDTDGSDGPTARAQTDSEPGLVPGGERLYIGRRHVSDADGNPVVIDWRAKVSRAFYRASPGEPMGVVRRRRFGVEGGQLTALEDEWLTALVTSDEDGRATSSMLAREIERPRIGPMRDIVATIQPEQDELVRAPVTTTLCVQGAPGTGKTAVGLHRAAWLLYAYGARLKRSGVLVVGPNRAFLEHIGAVLPSLGEVSVQHTTMDELVEHARVRAIDCVAVATLKGQARMADVLRTAVWSRVRPATEPLVLPRGAYKWRVSADEVQDILDELTTRGVRYHAARLMLGKRLAHAVLVAMERAGGAPDDRVQDSVARSAPVKAYVASIWPKLTPAGVLSAVLSTGEGLAEDQRAMTWSTPARSPGAARWTSADLALLDEVADLLERTPSLGHVVLDEAQDLSPMQLRAVGRRASTGSLTVLGDIAQGTTPWATSSWEESLTHLGKDLRTSSTHLEVLERGFRVPALVIDYAARLLPLIAPGLGAPTSVRAHPGRLDILEVEDPVSAAVEAAGVASAEEGSVGIIVPQAWMSAVAAALAEAGVEHEVLDGEHGGDRILPVHLVPAPVAKGLEFDQVVVVEPAAIAAAEPDERTGLRRLYVVLTRAVSGLTVVHAQALPAALTDPEQAPRVAPGSGTAYGGAHDSTRHHQE